MTDLDPYQLPDGSISTAASDDDLDGGGIAPAEYALPNCPMCGGRGYVSMEDGGAMPRESMCRCVREGQRRAACEALINARFGADKSMTLASYDAGKNVINQAAHEGAINYVANFPAFQSAGVGIAFMGKVEAGKTHLAKGILMALVKRWSRADGSLLDVLAITMPELLRRQRQRFDDSSKTDVIEHAMRADVLLLDDIGAEYHRNSNNGGAASWAEEQLFLILDSRLSDGKPTLFTTNQTQAQLREMLHPRVARRLDTRTAQWYQVNPIPGKSAPDPGLAALLNPR